MIYWHIAKWDDFLTHLSPKNRLIIAAKRLEIAFIVLLSRGWVGYLTTSTFKVEVEVDTIWGENQNFFTVSTYTVI